MSDREYWAREGWRRVNGAIERRRRAPRVPGAGPADLQAENEQLRRELDQLSREVAGLRVALRSIFNALGPDRVCRCNVHDCGLAEEASDALETARAALAPSAPPAEQA